MAGECSFSTNVTSKQEIANTNTNNRGRHQMTIKCHNYKHNHIANTGLQCIEEGTNQLFIITNSIL